jgi:porin
MTAGAHARQPDDGGGKSDEAVPDELASSETAEGLLPLPDFTGDLGGRAYILGDWGGERTALAERGVQLNVDFVQHFQSVVSGGRSTSTEYGGSLDYLVLLDLQRMDVLPGALVTVRGESRYGDSINSDVGLLLPANTDLAFPLTDPAGDDLALAITELTYTQYLSSRLAVFLGKLNTLSGDPSEFANGRGKTQFGTSMFIFNPVTALAVPYSTLGAGLIVMPSDHLAVSASVFNTADSSTTTGFGDFGDGWSIAVEAQFSYSIGALPGGQNLGLVYAADGDFAKIGGKFTFQPGVGLAPSTSDDTWSIYWTGWQYLWCAEGDETPVDPSNGVPDRRGLGLFARAGVGDDDTLPIDFHVSGGLGGRGLVAGRPDDHFGLGYFYNDVRPNRLLSMGGSRTRLRGPKRSTTRR